ncbi:exocyst complex component 3-like protein isoform X1 [Lepisosteus oculatus]|uniref:exocyst complex component 3-like protein isoform X1 n=1 Tax=Lepisosteus oculatus TaxID=7918 RepID=UPI0035F52A54
MSDDHETGHTEGEVWPELEKAEKLARGAALKWASGVFYRPDQLERLAQYRKRETQRTASIQLRLKSAVQSHLEGVGWGLEQLRSAREAAREAARALEEARAGSRENAEGFRSLDHLREVAFRHEQLLAAVSNLPRLCSVPAVVAETRRLIKTRQLLEAHARLMEMESWQNSVLWQLQRVRGGAPSPEEEALVLGYFAGVKQLGEALATELWAVIGSGLSLVRQDPTPFVSAVRIIEREESMDQAFLEERAAGSRALLPPGRPRQWRARFFGVIEEAIATRFRATYLDIRGPGLASHLTALQNSIMSDLIAVKHLLEQCCPPHYRIAHTYLIMCHKCLWTHLQQVISWDLDSSEIFTVLKWVLHIYHGPEMMGHPDLCSEVEAEELKPLISQEALEKLQMKYVNTVRSSVSEWMHKALEVELTDWQRDQEPETDHEGFYHTSMATIITQMLEENVRVALMISEALRDQTILMGLYEMESFLNRFQERLVAFGKEHQKDRTTPKYYVHYLLAAINNCIILKSATESLQQQRSSASPCLSSRTPPSPHVALEKAIKRACHLVIDELLWEVQPQFLHVLCRSWLGDSELMDSLCGAVEQHCNLYSRAREPCQKQLVTESQWALVVEYVRALMQKRMVCRSAEERGHLAERMVQDAQQLQELFLIMAGNEESGSGQRQLGGELLKVLPALAEIVRLKDPSMLTLEVSGLVAKYPDISEEHVSVLLDVRGDVPREVRGTVLEMLETSAPPLPPGYRPIFTNILVPPPSMPFCLPTVKCA